MFPFQFSMTVELGYRRTTSFNESEASLLVIRQIRLCRRGASVAPRSRRLALCPCATATTLSLDGATAKTLSLDGATRWLASKTTRLPSCCRWVGVRSGVSRASPTLITSLCARLYHPSSVGTTEGGHENVFNLHMYRRGATPLCVCPCVRACGVCVRKCVRKCVCAFVCGGVHAMSVLPLVYSCIVS